MESRGGSSSKAGHAYEAEWTIFKFIDVLENPDSEIFLEPGKANEQGTEFRFGTAEDLEYHQAKKPMVAKRWTIANLREKGVLDSLLIILSTQLRAHYVFVSGSNAGELQALSERARKYDEFSRFVQEIQTPGSVQKGFEAIWRQVESLKEQLAAVTSEAEEDPQALSEQDIGAIQSLTREGVYQLLKRVDVRYMDDRLLRQINSRFLSFYFGDPEKVSNVLFRYCFDPLHFREELNRKKLLDLLASETSPIYPKEGFIKSFSRERCYSNIPELPAHHVQRDDVMGQVREKLILRPGDLALTSSLQETVQKRSIPSLALHGMGGIGKSVIAQMWGQMWGQACEGMRSIVYIRYLQSVIPDDSELILAQMWGQTCDGVRSLVFIR